VKTVIKAIKYAEILKIQLSLIKEITNNAGSRKIINK
jgi:hypothetical protein